MANVFNMGGGTDLVNATLKPGNKIVYSDGLEYHSEIPTEEKIVPVLGSSVVYAPYGLTGEVTELTDQGFWFVTGDFVSQSSVPTISLEPVSGVTYTDGIADLDPYIINDIAKAISNNNQILYTTETIYVDLTSIHRKVSVGNEIPIQFGNAVYQFRIIGFNHDLLSDATAYGSVTATGSAGLTLEMVNVYSQDVRIWSNSGDYETYVPTNDNLFLYSSVFPSLKQTIPVEWRKLLKYTYQNYGSAGSFSVDLFMHTINTLGVSISSDATSSFQNEYRDPTSRLVYPYYKEVTADMLKKTHISGTDSTYALDYLRKNGNQNNDLICVRKNPTQVVVSNTETTLFYSHGPLLPIAPLFCI